MQIPYALLSDNTVVEDVTKNVQEVTGWLGKIKESAVNFGIRFLIALVFLLVGRKLIGWCKHILQRSFRRSNLEEGVQKFLLSFVGIGLHILLLVAAVGILGIDNSSITAVVGSLGLTIGLALQGSLSNFAGGVLILVMKPFRIGDYILANGMEGTVTSIDVFYTRLLTIDNRKVVIPNGGLSNANIVNVTNEDNRRLDLLIPVSYQCDIKKVKVLLEQLVRRQEMILREEPISVFVDSFADSAIQIGVRMWTRKEDYWTLKWKLLEEIKECFDDNHISIPFNQLDVNLVNQSIN